ncbi:Low affinity iron permease [Aureobasidium subglaciale]|nr:Low affinity iron permease [Aureobasidium subglaciale]
MSRFVNFVTSIGERRDTNEAAPSFSSAGKEETQKSITTSAHIDTAKPKLLDRWLDKVVSFSGSNSVLFFTVFALLVWAFLGIKFGGVTGWQVGISDAQAIINMVFDSLLVREQLNSHTQALVVACHLDSRAGSHKRMLRVLSKMEKPRTGRQGHTTITTELPTEDLLGRICNRVSAWMGHISTVIGYWVCISIWLAFGSYCNWSNTWFFYINSATSALMIFMLALLGNNRERNKQYLQKCTSLLLTADMSLERKLRDLTGDKIDNEVSCIPAPKIGKIERAINFYADLVGTLLGIALLCFVLVAWNLCDICNRQEDGHYEQRILEDMDLMAILGADQVQEKIIVKPRLDVRLSIAMGNICSHAYTVVAGVICITGLILTASLMHWNELGQIVCNIPPSIIESFFTLILITGHNIGDEQRRADLQRLYETRLELTSAVEQWQV